MEQLLWRFVMIFAGHFGKHEIHIGSKGWIHSMSENDARAFFDVDANQGAMLERMGYPARGFELADLNVFPAKPEDYTNWVEVGKPSLIVIEHNARDGRTGDDLAYAEARRRCGVLLN